MHSYQQIRHENNCMQFSYSNEIRIKEILSDRLRTNQNEYKTKFAPHMASKNRRHLTSGIPVFFVRVKSRLSIARKTLSFCFVEFGKLSGYL